MDTIKLSDKEIEILVEEFKDINSPVYRKSIISFENIKNSILVDDILKEQDSQNEHIAYARLVMSPDLYEVLGDDNIEKMSLKRIHHFKHAFRKVEEKELHTVPCHILTNEKTTMEQITTFFIIRDIISEDPILVSILEKETGTEQQSSEYNESFAELIISEEKREALGKNAIINENMSPERMYTIEIRLSVEEITMLGEWITHENMTVDKIILIGEMLSKDDILKIGAENLAKMSIGDLQMEIF
ncbi:MAG: hypothetical protein QM490_00300 [Candidatus Gracilibacteria bacterium]